MRSSITTSRTVPALALGVLLTAGLTGCGGSNSPTSPGGDSSTPPPLEYRLLNRQPFSDSIRSVSVFNGRVVAGADEGAVLVREAGQENWQRIQAPTRGSFFAIQAIDQRQVLAANHEGTWLSRDGGFTWELVDETHNIREIAFRNGRAVAGGVSGIVFSDDLVHWDAAVSSPTNILDIGFAGDAVVWAMSRNAMFRSTDGGKNWVKIIERSTGPSFKAFAYATENLGTLAFDNGEISNTTNGTTFHLVRDLGSPVMDVDFSPAGLGILVTRNGDIFTSDDGGKSWAIRGSFIATPGIFDPAEAIDLLANNEVLVVGRDGFLGESSGGLSTFTEISSGFGGDMDKVAFSNATDGLAIHGSNGSELLLTRDAGGTWESAPIPEVGIQDIAVQPGSFALLLSRSGILYHSDQIGGFWDEVRSFSDLGIRFIDSCFILDDNTWITISVNVGAPNTLFRSNDAGTTWTEIATESAFIRAIDRFPGTEVLLAVGSGVIQSTDSGASWSGPVPNAFVSEDVACITDQIAIGIGSQTAYRTEDQGRTWVSVLEKPSDSSGVFTSVAFRDARQGVIVGENGLIFETRDGGLTWEEIRMTGAHLLDVVAMGDPASSMLIVGERGAVIRASEGAR